MEELDLRRTVCAQAARWIGRCEGNASHREIIDRYNEIRPLPRGYKVTYTDAWCASFVSAVGHVCGLEAWIYPECGCGPMIDLYKAAGRWMEDDSYMPNLADVIFYDWEDSGQGDNRGNPDHVGLVLLVDGETITVIEGNCGHKVATRKIRRNGRYIRGYGLPDYAAAASAINAHEHTEDDTPAVIEIPATQPTGNAEQTVVAPMVGTCRLTLPLLKRGANGPHVKTLQWLLIGHGLSCGGDLDENGNEVPDGIFGEKTEEAVCTYQEREKLLVDREVGGQTWGALHVM